LYYQINFENEEESSAVRIVYSAYCCLSFFASGINSFAKLPTITKNIPDINSWKTLDEKPVMLTGKITILGFIGEDVLKHKGNFFNLYEKSMLEIKILKIFKW